MSQRESKLSRAIMDELRTHGVFCFKVHGGPTMMAGLPDIVACVPVGVHRWQDGVEHGVLMSATMGMFVGFEVKNPDGGDPTPVQKHVHNRIRSAYGHVFVVRSVQDAVAALESLGVDTGTNRA